MRIFGLQSVFVHRKILQDYQIQLFHRILVRPQIRN
uniref:Uncharacterized protein n=1 Tax=Siphoviridae sp. ctH8e11 TaxID=2827567 RepID=A0A8S5LSE5_9CAUD|nr:MAG TPA: hypothetical protein [Siphoviridae sp. ctH8e11]